MDVLKIQKLRENAVLPARATAGSAGYDLCACLDAPVVLSPGDTVKIPTGLAMDVGSPQRAAFVFARSGLGIKHGIVPANCVGVIDSDYRGEVLVGLTNHGTNAFTVNHGDRIAQLVLLPVFTPRVVQCESLNQTGRGAGGFGSTGISGGAQ